MEDLFGLNRGDWYESGVLQMDGCVNLMKGAMVTADAVTTVSPTYAAQLRESAYAAGLDSVVRSIQWKFSGVLNGIDMVSYDPECDPNLPARYTAAESEGKTLCKAALQQELGLAQEEGTPVLSMVTRLVGHKGVDLVCQALDGIMATGCQLVVLGSGDGGYENFFRHAQNRYPGRLCAWIGYNEGLSRRIYAGSDLFLMPSKSEPCGLSQMIAMRYGAVPIVRQTGGLNDTVRSCQVGQPDGNGYVFAAYDEFFSPSRQLQYVEVTANDPSSISDFGQFYTDIYMAAFPDDNEREGFDHFLKYLKNAVDAREYRYHIILAKDESGHVVGGCVFNYFKKSNTGVIEFLAVRRDLQSGGIGTMIYKHIASILSEDAFRMSGKPLDYICCEIDSPEYSRAEIKKYLYFWDKNHFRHLDFSYVQPALSGDQEPVSGLWFTISPQHASVSDIPSRLVADILYDYVKFAMGIADPDQNTEYRNMKEELLAHDSVDVSRII